MKAIVYDRYGSPDVLELKEIDKPSANDDELLVRVRAASVNPYDWHFMTGLPHLARMQLGLLKPKTRGLGADVAGEVESVGENVTQFRPGDEVFAGVEAGAFAEYVCVSNDSVMLKPANLTFEQAAAVPMAALTAMQGLRGQGRIEPGHKVLINGASGGVGTFAVQIAKSLGAEVTAVCSTRNVDLVRSIGADHVIDYTSEDFTRGERRYDLILDNVGNRSPSECRRVLNRKGTYLASFGRPENRWLGPMGQLLRMALLSPFVGQKLAPLSSKKRSMEDRLVLRELLEAGKVTSVIDRTYPLSEVAEAMRYLEKGHARGKVVITVGRQETTTEQSETV